jgi:hypothetical protein
MLMAAESGGCIPAGQSKIDFPAEIAGNIGTMYTLSG